METLLRAMNISGEGESFGRLARPPVTDKGHRGKQARKWGSRKTSFPDWPKPTKMGSMGRLCAKNPTMAWSLSTSHDKEVCIA